MVPIPFLSPRPSPSSHLDASAEMMCTPWSISGPDGRLPPRSHTVKPTVARAAHGAKKLLTLRVPVASEGIDHAEMPVERAVVLEHQLPTTRAELSPPFNLNRFRHSPSLTPLAIVRRSALFVNATSLPGLDNPARAPTLRLLVPSSPWRAAGDQALAFPGGFVYMWRSFVERLCVEESAGCGKGAGSCHPEKPQATKDRTVVDSPQLGFFASLRMTTWNDEPSSSGQ